MVTKKNKSTKTRSAAKPVAKPPVVPAVVKELHDFASLLQDRINVIEIPESVRGGRDKLVASIEKYANRVAANLAGAGKKAEKEAAKAKRAEAKKGRDATKRTKKVAARDALKAKLAKMEKDLES